MRILILSVFLIYSVLSLRFENIPAGYRVKDVETYDCRWICDDDGSHWTQFLECALDEIAVGTCGVESRTQCNSDLYCNGLAGYAALECCKAEVVLEAIAAP